MLQVEGRWYVVCQGRLRRDTGDTRENAMTQILQTVLGRTILRCANSVSVSGVSAEIPMQTMFGIHAIHYDSCDSGMRCESSKDHRSPHWARTINLTPARDDRVYMHVVLYRHATPYTTYMRRHLFSLRRIALSRSISFLIFKSSRRLSRSLTSLANT